MENVQPSVVSFFRRSAGPPVAVVGVLLILAAAQPLRAQSTFAEWVGGSTGDYDNPANWSTGSVPDVFTGQGIVTAYVQEPSEGIKVSITHNHHTLDTLVGFNFTLEAHRDLRIRELINGVNLRLEDGKDLILDPGAFAMNLGVTARDSVPAAVPRVRFVTDAANPSGTPTVIPIGSADFITDDGATPLVIDATKPDGTPDSDAVLWADGATLNLRGDVTIGVPIDASTGRVFLGPTGFTSQDVTQSFTGTINVPITMGLPGALPFDGRIGGAADLEIRAQNVDFGPAGKLIVNPDALVRIHDPRDELVGPPPPGLPFDVTRFDVQPGAAFDLRETTTYNQFRYLYDAGAQIRITDPINFENQRLAADAALLPTHDVEYERTVSLRNAVFFNPGGGLVSGELLRTLSLGNVTFEGGLDLTNITNTLGASSLQIVPEAGSPAGTPTLIRGGEIRVFSSVSGAPASRLVNARLENTRLNSRTDLSSPIQFEGPATLIDSRVRGSSRFTDDIDLADSSLIWGVVEFDGTRIVSGKGFIDSQELTVKNDITFGPEVRVDLDGRDALEAEGHDITVLHELNLGGCCSFPLPTERALLEARSITVGEHFGVGSSGAELEGNLFLETDTLTFLTIDADPAGIGDPATYRSLVVEGTAHLDGELEVFVEQVREENFEGLRVILVEATEIANRFASIRPSLPHRSDPDGVFTEAILYTDTTVEAVIARVGDANLNGQVEQGDLDAVLQNWGNTGTEHGSTWITGDLNQNGQVEQGDLDEVLQNWGSVAAPDFAGSDVPEPATTALMSLGGLLASTRRVRQGCR